MQTCGMGLETRNDPPKASGRCPAVRRISISIYLQGQDVIARNVEYEFPVDDDEVITMA